MSTLQTKLKNHWRDVAHLALGVFLAISPWAFDFAGGTPAWNSHVAGILVALLALSALWVALQAWEQWALVAVGLWLIGAPWVLGFADLAAATWTSVGVGLVVGALALYAILTSEESGRLAARS